MWLRRPTEPDVLAAAKGRLTEELEREWGQKRSRGPEPDPILRDPGLLDSLLRMTEGTCAYCERPLESQGPDSAVVTHHRPTWGAVGLDGEVTLQAYWWLTYEWTNLYPACADCVRSRGTRFPVAGPRATSPGALADEQPSLLDPLLDDPDEHLRYQGDGTVTALTERGRVTVEILALNRDFLIKSRLAALQGQPASTRARVASLLTARLTPRTSPLAEAGTLVQEHRRASRATRSVSEARTYRHLRSLPTPPSTTA